MLNSIFNFNFTINKIIIILWDFYNYHLSLLSVFLFSIFYILVMHGERCKICPHDYSMKYEKFKFKLTNF